MTRGDDLDVGQHPIDVARRHAGVRPQRDERPWHAGGHAGSCEAKPEIPILARAERRIEPPDRLQNVAAHDDVGGSCGYGIVRLQAGDDRFRRRRRRSGAHAQRFIDGDVAGIHPASLASPSRPRVVR